MLQLKKQPRVILCVCDCIYFIGYSFFFSRKVIQCLLSNTTNRKYKKFTISYLTLQSNLNNPVQLVLIWNLAYLSVHLELQINDRKGVYTHTHTHIFMKIRLSHTTFLLNLLSVHRISYPSLWISTCKYNSFF